MTAGSFTLTSGVPDRDPVLKAVNAATVNGALKGFVTSAAIELERGIRINAVSPGLLEESAKKYEGLFPGHETVSIEAGGPCLCKERRGRDYRAGHYYCVITPSHHTRA